MAKKVTVTLVDDFDGEGAADETVEFGLDGVTYEIDLSAKNATKRPSGDQKGKTAPSVPGMVWASIEFMGRIHSKVLPSEPAPVKASDDPSGESTGGPA